MDDGEGEWVSVGLFTAMKIRALAAEARCEYLEARCGDLELQLTHLEAIVLDGDD